MGKSKRPPRTKGNTRPSSSGHSAQLLGSVGMLPPSVFFGLQIDPKEVLDMKGSSEDVESSTGDSDTRIVLKKMLKRDAVTKLKALCEFIDLCSEESCDVKSILPHWPRVFNKLALDSDRRVREKVHIANEKLVLRVKRDITPYLKSFMGTWLITQCDSSVASASAAQFAFSSVFPPEKQSEALMFCRSEIIRTIRDGLFQLSPGTFSEPNVSTEECSEKYNFVLMCTISGMKLLVLLLSHDDKKKIEKDVTSIVGEPDFWAYSKNESAQIRGAWYALISSLCCGMPEVFHGAKNNLIVSAMSALSESHPIVAPAVWECALQVGVIFEDWWQHINIFKVVLPNLRKLFKQCGMGNAAIVYPSLLPFLSRLPKDIFETGDNFLKEFFFCFRISFCHSRLKVRRECNAVVKAFLECLSYSADTLLCNPQYDSCIVQSLLNQQLIPLIRDSLNPEESHLAASSFYPLLRKFLQHFEVQAISERTSGKPALYSNSLTIFLEAMYSEFTDIVNMEHSLHHKELSTLALFFHSLHHSPKYVPDRKKYVHLDIDDVNFDEVVVTSSDTIPRQNTFASMTCSLVFEYTVKFCKYLCLKLEDDLQPCCLKLFAEVVSAISSPKLFLELLLVFHIPVKEETQAPHMFFHEVILNWAKRCSFDGISIGIIADIILGISSCIGSCVNLDSALKTLDISSKLECQKLFVKIVPKLMESKTEKDLRSQWFQTKAFAIVFGSMMRRLVRQITIAQINVDCRHQIALYRETVLNCLSGARIPRRPVIPGKLIAGILDICSHFLSNPIHIINDSQEDHAFINLVCDICDNLFPYSMENCCFKSLDSLMLRIFTLSLDPEEKFNIAEKQQKRLCHVWQSSIAKFVPEGIEIDETGFLSTASYHLHKLLQMHLSAEMRRRVGDITLDFLNEVKQACLNKVTETYHMAFYDLMLVKIFPSFDEWEFLKAGLNLCTLPSILKGKWFYPIEPKVCVLVCHMDLPQLVTTAEIVSGILCTLLCPDGKFKCNRVLRKAFLEHLPHLLWSVCYIESREFFQNKTEIEPPVASNLQHRCMKLVSFFANCDTLQFLFCNLFDRTLRDGMKWGIAFEKLASMLPEISRLNITESIPVLARKILEPKELNESIAVQVCLRNGSLQFRLDFLECLSADFFNANVPSSLQLDYYGVLSEVVCCVSKLPIENIPESSQVQLVSYLNDLTNFHRFHGNFCENLVFVVNFSTLSSVILQKIPDALSCATWYSVFDVVVAWFKHCFDIIEKVPEDSSAQIFLHHTCKAICIISQLFAKNEAHEKLEYYSLPVNARWHEIYDDVISSSLLQLFLIFADNVSQMDELSYVVELMMNMLSQAVEYMNVAQIIETLLPVQSENCGVMKSNMFSRLQQLTPFLLSQSLSLQFGIHSILTKIVVQIPKLPYFWSREDKSDFAVALGLDDDDKDWFLFKSFPIVEMLLSINGIIEAMMAPVKLENEFTLEPYTVAYTYIIAYLLIWTELLEYFSATFSEERSAYLACFEEEKLLSSMLMNVIRLSPGGPGYGYGHVSSGSNMKRRGFQSFFFTPPPVATCVAPQPSHLHHVACNLYCNTLRKVPALVRTWWNGLDKKTAETVEKLTTFHISGLLSACEIDVIYSGNIQFNNMTVKARTASREVIATYTVDDFVIELVIQLPSNYPLGPIVADSSKRMGGICQCQLRSWLLQLTRFLNYHNGSILDALALWKKNLDKKFEGVEECMVCYFIVHSASGKIPAVCCSTCKKKFHSDCLYQWFNTSNSSACPICRGVF